MQTQTQNTVQSSFVKTNKQQFKYKKPLKSKIHDILWNGNNPYPDTNHSYLIKFKYLRMIRAVFMLFAFFIICCEWFEEEYGFINFKFLTFWGEVLTFSFFFLTTINKYWKIAHLLFEIDFSLQITVCLMYWIAVYPTQDHDGSAYFYFKTISAHGGMFLLIWIDNILNEIRFFKRHAFFLTMFIGTYLLVNIIVTFYDKPVYKPIDWTTIACYIYIVAAVVLGLSHFFLGIAFYDSFKRKRIEKHKQKYRNSQSVKYQQQIRQAHKFRRGDF